MANALLPSNKRLLDQVRDRDLTEGNPLGPQAGPWASLILSLRGLSELEQVLAGASGVVTGAGLPVVQGADARQDNIKTLADTFDATQIASHNFPDGTRGFRVKNTGAAAMRFAVDEAPDTVAWDGTFRVGQEIAAGEESEFRLIESTATEIHVWGTNGETYTIEVF